MTSVIGEDAPRETESRGQTMSREATQYHDADRQAARWPPSGQIMQLKPPGDASSRWH